MQSSVRSASTRVIIQNALQRYNNGNDTDGNWEAAQADLEAAVDGDPQIALMLQAQIFPRDANGPAGFRSVLTATGSEVNGRLPLPYTNSDGSPVYLGEPGLGFPPNLYPNLTYGSIRFNDTFNEARAFFSGETLHEGSTLLLGPWQVNRTFALASMTMPIINNTSSVDILGWLSVVMDARLIHQVLAGQEGLDRSGVALLVGPTNVTNRFPPGVLYNSDNANLPDDVQVSFELFSHDILVRARFSYVPVPKSFSVQLFILPLK